LDYRTIQADPNHDSELARVENQRAISLLEKGKIEKAEQSLQQALIADVTYGPAHNNLGKLYFSQGKYYLAAWEFEYAVKLMPHRAECQNNLGLVYEAVGKLDEAIDAYTLAFGMDGKNPVIIGNLARARVRRGDTDRIVEQLLNDLRLYDTRPPWLQWANERLALGPLPATDTDSAPRRPPPPLSTHETADDDLGEPIRPPVPDVEPPEELPWPGAEH
jgi:tetratricopeptide (TPR) repeat protein